MIGYCALAPTCEKLVFFVYIPVSVKNLVKSEIKF